MCYEPTSPLPGGTKIQTIPGGVRPIQEWTGTIASSIAVNDGSWRYEVWPDESCWAKVFLKPHQTLRIYSYELKPID